MRISSVKAGSALLGLSLCLLSVFSGACASARPPASSGSEFAAVTSDLDLRAVLLLLVDRQLYESVIVRRALAGDAAMRETLADSLGRIPEKRGRGVLEGLLLDEVAAVRRAAAFSLGELEDPEAEGALLKAATDADRETGMLAVEALGKLKVPVVDVAQVLLPLSEEERWARLLPPLFRFHEENAVALANRGLERPEPELHAWAAYALARDPLPSGLPALRRLLSDPDPQVRAWAARGLGIVGEAEDIPPLTRLFDNAEIGPVVHALRAVKALVAARQKAPPRDAIPALLLLLRDERPGVRVTALDAAAAWLPDTTLAEAVTAFAAGGSGRERGTALLSLAAAGVPHSHLLVAEAAAAADAEVRARAAEAAVRLGEGEIAARLAVDASPLVRTAALAASLEGAKEDGAAIALAALADRDQAVRGSALDWLAEHPQEARKIPFEKLQRPFAAALTDRDPESGLSAVRAMAALAEAEPLVRGSLVALLEQAAGLRAYPLRREAGLALGRLGQAVPELGPARPIRDLGVYRQIVERTAMPRTVEVKTARGSFRIRLACPTAPLTCLNFLQLAGQGYFDGLSFHRVVADFVVQGGDPRGDGFGGPGYTIRDEINRLRYKRGAVGMALAGPDTGGSQFFVALSPQPHLDGGYTVFGEVVSGMEVVDRLVVGDVMVTVKEAG